MFKYLWLLPIIFFVIYWVIVCIQNVGIKDFIADIILSLLIGFGVGCIVGLIGSILGNSLLSFFFAYDDMNAIVRSIKECGLVLGCVGAMLLTLMSLIEDYNYNMSDSEIISRFWDNKKED